MTAEEALQRLLDGSGFTYRMEPDQTVTLVALPPDQSGPARLAPAWPPKLSAPAGRCWAPTSRRIRT